MRVAFFSTLNNASWGGCEVLWYKTAIHFKQKGIAVACFVTRWPIDPDHVVKLRSNGVEVFYYVDQEMKVLEKIQRKIHRIINKEKSVFKNLIKWNPDYVIFSQGHSYDLGYFTDASIYELINSKISYSIICQNNTDYSFVPPDGVLNKVATLYRKARQVWFVSNRNMESAILHLCENFSNFTVISNSLSISENQIGILPYPETSTINFASVANLKCSHKGQNILIHVLSQSKWKERNWILNLYGKGEDEIYLKRLTAFLSMEDRVFFKGHNDNIESVWKTNHMLILASFGEGLPLALQEAMLLGRPAIGTDVGGNGELIKEGETGFLAEGTTFQAIDMAFERAWASKEKWIEIGINAFNMASLIVDLAPEETIYNSVKYSLNN